MWDVRYVGMGKRKTTINGCWEEEETGLDTFLEGNSNFSWSENSWLRKL